MSREEFLRQLKEALNMSLEQNAINEQIDYYDKYISDEVKKGKSEKEVLDELGDPRLIAKTIKTVNGNKTVSDTNEDTYQEQGSSSHSRTYENTGNTGRRYTEYVSNTGTIGCVIAGLIIFIIIYGLLRMFGFMAYGLGSLALSGPLGFIVVLLLLLFFFGGGRRM